MAGAGLYPCFKIAGLTTEEKDVVRSRVLELKKQGISGEVTAQKEMVRRLIAETEAERNNTISAIKKSFKPESVAKPSETMPKSTRKPTEKAESKKTKTPSVTKGEAKKVQEEAPVEEFFPQELEVSELPEVRGKGEEFTSKKAELTKTSRDNVEKLFGKTATPAEKDRFAEEIVALKLMNSSTSGGKKLSEKEVTDMIGLNVNSLKKNYGLIKGRGEIGQKRQRIIDSKIWADIEKPTIDAAKAEEALKPQAEDYKGIVSEDVAEVLAEETQPKGEQFQYEEGVEVKGGGIGTKKTTKSEGTVDLEDAMRKMRATNLDPTDKKHINIAVNEGEISPAMGAKLKEKAYTESPGMFKHKGAKMDDIESATDKAADFVNQGKTYAEVAEEAGLTKAEINAWRKASHLEKGDAWETTLYQAKEEHRNYRDMTPLERNQTVEELNRVLKGGWTSVYDKQLDDSGLTNFERKVIKIGSRAKMDAGYHETLHYATMALGESKAWRSMLKGTGLWDGKGAIHNFENTRAAHEALSNEFADYAMKGEYGTNKMFDKMRSFFKKTANFLQGKGFYDKADYFRQLARGTLKEKSQKQINEDIVAIRLHGELLDHYKLSETKPNGYIVKATTKIGELLGDTNETLVINDAFWKRVQKGQLNKEAIALLEYIVDANGLEGGKIKSSLFKYLVAQSVAPIHINRMQTISQRRGQSAGQREVVQESKEGGEIEAVYRGNYVEYLIRPTKNMSEETKSRIEFLKKAYTKSDLPVDKSTKEYGDEVMKALGLYDFIEKYLADDYNPYTIRLNTSGDFEATPRFGEVKKPGKAKDILSISLSVHRGGKKLPGEKYDKIYEYRNKIQFEDYSIGLGGKEGSYGIWSFDDMNGKVKQVHDYWSEENSIGWFRGDESFDGKDAFRVQELQSQLQYTRAPKFENLKLGQRLKIGGINVTVKELTSHKWLNETVPTVKIQVDESGVTNRYSLETYNNAIRLGEQQEFLKAMQPKWHESFIDQVMQWAHNKGYKSVRFPINKTVDAIERFNSIDYNLEQTRTELRDNTEALKSIMEIHKKVENADINNFEDFYFEMEAAKGKLDLNANRQRIELIEQILEDVKRSEEEAHYPNEDVFPTQDVKSAIVYHKEGYSERSIQLEEILAAGEDAFPKVMAVKNFYDKTIGDYLRKFRKGNVAQYKDEGGYEWLDVKIDPKDHEAVTLFQKNEVPGKAILEQRLNETQSEYDKAYEEGMRSGMVRLDKKGVTQVINAPVMGDFFKGIKAGVKKAWQLYLPPTYLHKTIKGGEKAYPKFDQIYNILQDGVVRGHSQRANEILKTFIDPNGDKGWYNGKPFRDLADKRTGVDNRWLLTEALEKHEMSMYDGTRKERLSWDEFKEEYFGQLDADTKEKVSGVFDIIERVTEQANQEARDGYRDRLLYYESSPRLVNLLNKAEKEAYFSMLDKPGKFTNEELAEFIDENPHIRKQISEDFADQAYDFGDKVYYNSVRPVTPNTYIIKASKSSENIAHLEAPFEELRMGKKIMVDGKEVTVAYKTEEAVHYESEEAGMGEMGREAYEEQAPRTDRVETYADNITEANEIVRNLEAKGYTVPERGFFKVGDLLKNMGELSRRLTDDQLISLANTGHIALDDPIMERLFKAIKSGTVKQHGIHKRNIPGMKFSPQELEMQLERLVNESLASKYRHNALLEANASHKEWLKDHVDKIISTKIGDTIELPNGNKVEITQELVNDTRIEADLITRYINNMTYSDKSVVDGYKSWAASTYTALKGAFIVQQALQGTQTTFPMAIAEIEELNKSGIPVSKAEAVKIFGESYPKSVEAMQLMRKYNLGDRENIPKEFAEFVSLMKDLTNQGLINTVGISNYSGGSFNDYYEIKDNAAVYYGSKPAKTFNAFKKYLNMASAGVEKFTRVQSAWAFYKIAELKGITDYNAKLKYMGGKVHDTMSQWGVAGRPLMFASKKLGAKQNPWIKGMDKSVFTFKTYGSHNVGMYESFMRKKLWTSFAIKALVGAGYHGITKFPLMAGGFALINLFTDDDVDYEIIRALDDLNDTAGIPIARVLGRGIPSLWGMDTRQLMDERSVLPTDAYAETRAYSPEGKFAEAMLGAPYGLGKDIIDSAMGVSKLLWNNIAGDVSLTEKERKRAMKYSSKILPLFLRNALKSFTLAEDGVELNGKTIIKADDLDWADVLYKFMSFQPMSISEAYEEQFQGIVAKAERAEGAIRELKTIRKEADNVTDRRKVNLMIREKQKELAKLKWSDEYRDARRRGVIK